MTGAREGASFDEAATALQPHMIAMFLRGARDGRRRPNVRAGRGVQLWVRVVRRVRRVYVRGCSERNRARRTGSAVGVSRPPRNPRPRVEPDVHRRVRAHAARRRRAGRGRVEAGAGRGESRRFRRGDGVGHRGGDAGGLGWRGLCVCVAPFAVGMAWYGRWGAGGGAGGRVPAGRGCGDGDGDGEAAASKFHLRSVL